MKTTTIIRTARLNLSDLLNVGSFLVATIAIVASFALAM